MRGPRRRARRISFNPSHTCFKPCGVRGRGLDAVELRADEFEALRLMDYEGLYQEECAQRMGISRPTLSRMVAAARYKVADALMHGKRILIATTVPPAALGPGGEGAASAEAHVLKPGLSPASVEPEVSPCAAPLQAEGLDVAGASPAQGRFDEVLR